jgi:magnesium-protoporphyrin IX monomethyl ester (oxidative) cyclase
MRPLLVHPSSLMYSEIFLRLEPLGLERVAGAAREAGHEVRVVDLQVFSRAELTAEMASFQPAAIGISLNYLANIPEAIEISVTAKQAVPAASPFLGGHSVSFIADDVLKQAAGSVDAIIRGEGETAIGPLLQAIRDGGLDAVPGAGPPQAGARLPRPRTTSIRRGRRAT